jgi:hypothetical protein
VNPTPRVSVLTASARPDGLPMVARCLHRQTEPDYEWLLCLPEAEAAKVKIADPRVRVMADPPRRPGDFYRLNGAWNRLVAAARSDLLVFAVDWIWFGPDALERFAGSHREDPAAMISALGHHYRKVLGDRPEVLWNYDGRAAQVGDDGAMPAEWMELSFASLPRPKVLEVGGFDEAYDRGAGCSEKELALRLERAGCSAFLGWGVEHRIFTHAKASSTAEWDAAYRRAGALLADHAREIAAGSRRVLDTPGLGTDTIY